MKNENEIKNNLENPVFTNLDVLLDKSRAKLISFSLLGFFIWHYDIDIKKGLSFLGIIIKNIIKNGTTKNIKRVIFFVCFFLLKETTNSLCKNL